MFARINSFGVNGVGGFPVSLEVYITKGLPSFDIVGLPDAAVKESRERVRAAIKICGYNFPISRMTVNLAPADMKKTGTVYDLPMLIGILSATGTISAPPENCAFVGEISLMGQVRPVAGTLPMAISASREGIKHFFVPADNAEEACFADGISVYPVNNLSELIAHLNGIKMISPIVQPDLKKEDRHFPDFSDVKGQENVKRAFEIAAAGGHNLLIVGPPGAGKSMMAKRLPGILPDMTKAEMVETTEIYSVAGLTTKSNPVIFERPFRSPHHTVSAAGLAGGGSIPKPGEISLAHNGVLFLDELPEFKQDALEVLRQPLEDGTVTVSRVSGSITFPSSFMLVCAMNPCKCGWYGHPSGRCKCSETDVKRYQSRISGPLMDRIDLIVEVPALEFEELKSRASAESSAEIKKRVNSARKIQSDRFGNMGVFCNAGMDSKSLRENCVLSYECEELMHMAYKSMNLSARSYDRILRVARTIADLDMSADIMPEHLAEAIQFRTFDFRE